MDIARWPILASRQEHLPVQRWVIPGRVQSLSDIGLAAGLYGSNLRAPLGAPAIRADRFEKKQSWGLAEPAGEPGHVPDDKLILPVRLLIS